VSIDNPFTIDLPRVVVLVVVVVTTQNETPHILSSSNSQNPEEKVKKTQKNTNILSPFPAPLLLLSEKGTDLFGDLGDFWVVVF